ncbi:hypothetical protein F5B17DRAFT_451268 [Nemania serpens]|nr:hypothetical protein F5B17DRAFT_451268 [Nemania serpens]
MKLITSVRSLWRRPLKQPNVNLALLQLPVELLDYIATFVAPADKVLLSQTCRSMRVCLSKYSSTAHLSCAEYFAYLAGIARQEPKQWVCDFSMALHPIKKRDKPTNRLHPCSCPVSILGDSRRRTRLQNPQHIGIEHHHVQLALKYTRLQQRKYDSYLKTLLKPYPKKPFKTLGQGCVTHEARYSAYPRIATGSDGNPRFLLYSVWEYFAGGRNIIVHNLGRQRICPHLQFRGDDRNCYSAYKNNLFQTFRWALCPEYAGAEWRNACPRCATDLSVVLCGRTLYLQVWQDFGPEGSPLDLAWRSQNIRAGLDGVDNTETTGPTLYHEPGSVEKLYRPAPYVVPLPKHRADWYMHPQKPSP